MPKGKDTIEIKRWVTLPDGSRKRRSFYGATVEDAESEWRRAESPALAYPDLPPGSFSWWLVFRYKPLKDHLEGNTRDNIQFAVRHLVPEIGLMPMREINATVLATALTNIARKKTARSRHYARAADGSVARDPATDLPVVVREWNFKPLANSSVNRCRAVALEVCDLAAEEKAMEPINHKRVPVREELPLEIVPYDPREMRRLWLKCQGSIAEVPVFLMGFLGLTVNEARAVDRVDLAPNGNLTLWHMMKPGGERSRKMKNRHRSRVIPLPPAMLEALTPHMFGDGPMCCNTNGDRVDEDGLDRAVHAKMRLAGLRRLTLHQLRHSFSSWLEENGCPRATRLALMGQSRKAVQDRYNHASDGAMREWLGRLWEASLLDFEEGRAPVEPPVNRGGARTPAVGLKNGRTKLDDAKVKAILERVASGEGDSAIAKDYKVDPQAIRQIRLGLTWKHVPRDAA